MTDILGRGNDQMTPQFQCVARLLTWSGSCYEATVPSIGTMERRCANVQGIITLSNLVFFFRREASLTRLLYNLGTEGVLEEQIRFSQKQLMALTGNHCHACSLRSVQAQVSSLHSSEKNTRVSFYEKLFKTIHD